MNIDSINKTNDIAFNAKLKIIQHNTFSLPNSSFDEWFRTAQEKWREAAKEVGTGNDIITIRLGKSVTDEGMLKYQHMSADAKINRIQLIRDDLNFNYLVYKSGRIDHYCENFDKKVLDFISFLKELTFCRIVK